MGESMSQPVLLPDSNIWVYLVDADAVESFRKEARRLGVVVAACPAVAFEFLRAPLGPVAKKKRINALTLGAWRRLMPEAFKEAEEARRAIARLHPDWLNPSPDRNLWFKVKADWEQTWWTRTRKNPGAEAALITAMEGDSIDQAGTEAVELRERAKEGRLAFDSINFDVLAVPASKPYWWDGQPFEPWRVQFASILLKGLERGDGAYADWLTPWLKSDFVEDVDWYRLWIREVTKEEMPLAWLRWAFQWVQATRTTTHGTPVDNQIATYLPECDVFVTSDKAFAACVEKVRPHSPARLGRGLCVPANDAAVDAVMDALKDLAS
jgi:hypothetical protein